MLKQLQVGFTLTELQLALALTALLATSMVAWSTSWQGRLQQQVSTAEAAANHWLHWLWNDLLNSTKYPNDWQLEPEHQCLLYEEVGVRVKNNALQWRPQNAGCQDPGWQGLNDPHRVRFKALRVMNTQLCLEFTAPQAPRVREEVCLPWPLS